MTLPAEIPSVTYVADGSNPTDFPFTRRCLDALHVLVELVNVTTGVVTDLTPGTDYTVLGVGQPGGVTVRLIAPANVIATGNKLVIRRVLPVEQLLDLVRNGPFPAESVEVALDRLTMIGQQLTEVIGRAIVLQVGGGGVSPVLPAPAALRHLRWNSGATALENFDADSAYAAASALASLIASLGTAAYLSSSLFLLKADSLSGIASASTARTNLGLGAAALLGVSNDPTLAGASSSNLVTEQAAKAYADALIGAQDAMVFKGVIDCSANPNYPAADRGHSYRVSVAGKIGGASGTNVEVGDLCLCLTDSTASGTQAGVGGSWGIIQANIDGAVVGPASATDGFLALFNGTTGKLLRAASIASTITPGGIGAQIAALVSAVSIAATGTQNVDWSTSGADRTLILNVSASGATVTIASINLASAVLGQGATLVIRNVSIGSITLAWTGGMIGGTLLPTTLATGKTQEVSLMATAALGSNTDSTLSALAGPVQ